MPKVTRTRESREREARVEGRHAWASIVTWESGPTRSWAARGSGSTRLLVHARDASAASLDHLQEIDRVLQRELRGSLHPDHYGYRTRPGPGGRGEAVETIEVKFDRSVHDPLLHILEPLVAASGEPKPDRYLAISAEEFERAPERGESKSFEGPFSSVDAAAEFIAAEFGVQALVVDLGELGARQFEAQDGRGRDDLALDRIIARGRPLAKSRMERGETRWTILDPAGQPAAKWT